MVDAQRKLVSFPLINSAVINPYVECSTSEERGVVMNKPFYIFAALGVLFLGLSLYAPPSWYEWIPLQGGHPVVVFPVLCATFTLWAIFQIPSIGEYLIRKGILVDPSKKD